MTCRHTVSRPLIVVGANNRPAGSHYRAGALRESNLVRLADHQSSRIGQPYLAAASERGPFIQAVLDVLTVCYWLALIILIAGAVSAAIVTLGWFVFFYL